MIILTILLSSVLLTACSSSQDNDNAWRGIQAGMEDLSVVTERTEYYDIVTEPEPLFQWGREDESFFRKAPFGVFVGMQFYQGEPVQLWTEPNFGEGSSALDLCLYRTDGSREVLLTNIPVSIGSAHCYLDNNGNCFLLIDSYSMSNDETEETKGAVLRKYLPSGEIFFEKQYDYGFDITDICQTADGRLYGVIRRQEGKQTLEELDPDSGLVLESDKISLESPAWGGLHLGLWENTLVTFQADAAFGGEITALDIQNRTQSPLLFFTGTSYTIPFGYSLCDFRVLKDQTIEILWSTPDGSDSFLERLRMTRIEKTPIVLRGQSLSWLTTPVAEFNKNSEEYHVVLEDCGLRNDIDDFARLTSIQIATGKGPDILSGSLMQDYLYGLMETGALEDLRPYLEKSGIREEDFFPFTFNTLSDGSCIYGVNPIFPILIGYLADSAVLGGTKEPDIDSLTDALLARQEDAAFLAGFDSLKLLELLLAGTDTLWGMVDWEQRSCDFSGELFEKILETAKRYGDNGGRNSDSYIAEYRNISDVFFFDSLAERKREEKTICGVLFDDGCHVASSPASPFAINANSANKAGAWEFIRFLLSDENQASTLGIPVSRKAFDARLDKQKALVADGKEHGIISEHISVSGRHIKTEFFTFTEADLTQEKIEEYIGTLEDVRPYPIRTAPIIEIIREEAAGYFSGSKNAAQVAETVANRVRLYLNE